jgi:uncharacterized protein
MKQLIKTVVAGVAVALSFPCILVCAADNNQDQMDRGGAAYRSGDYALAAMWYRKAADGGNAIAWSLLGDMSRDGVGVLQDYTEAVVWFQKAADYGYAISEVELGGMYLHGYGVTQDYVRAHMLFNLAATHAIDELTRDLAAKYRDIAATKMTPAQIAEAQRMARDWVPAKQ